MKDLTATFNELMDSEITGGVIMKGIFYRLGVNIKNAGEKAGHKEKCYAGFLVRLGLAIRDFVRAI